MYYGARMCKLLLRTFNLVTRKKLSVILLLGVVLIHLLWSKPIKAKEQVLISGRPRGNNGNLDGSSFEFKAVHHEINTNNLPAPIRSTLEESTELKHVVLLISRKNYGAPVSRLLKSMFIPHKKLLITPNQTLSPTYVVQTILSFPRCIVSLIIFADYAIFSSASQADRVELNHYFLQQNISIIGFFNEGKSEDSVGEKIIHVKDLPLALHRLPAHPWGMYTARKTPILRILRYGLVQPGLLSKRETLEELEETVQEKNDATCCQTTLVFQPNYQNQYIPLIFTRIAQNVSTIHSQTELDFQNCATNNNQSGEIYQSLAVYDSGLIDGIKRVLFATYPNGLWVNMLILLDSIHYLTNGRLHSSAPAGVPIDEATATLMARSSNATDHLDLVRRVLLDVDDVFTERPNDRLLPEDVKYMLNMQTRWRRIIPGFTFNLGFTGESYDRVRTVNPEGYDALLANRKAFWWFDHIWNHSLVNDLTEETLVGFIQRNVRFADQKELPLLHHYSVTPSHSGIYPIYMPLINAWLRMSSTRRVTATMNYKIPRGAQLGFKVGNIQVLPRQECWLYSTHRTISEFPGGRKAIEQLVSGGYLFQKILFNPINIFMTHFANYQYDRLGPLLFDALFNFVSTWTNLKLRTARPTELAELYLAQFKSFGANEFPVPLRNCDRTDPNFWPFQWPCHSDRLPNFFIVGPHKTGTTALQFFLRLNPELRSNRYQPAPHYEEMQFFDKTSVPGHTLNWYSHQFPVGVGFQRFEKSAAYFSEPLVPSRIASVLQEAKIIVMLMDPVERAYSWYQHLRAHLSPVTSVLSFSQLVNLDKLISEGELPSIVIKKLPQIGVLVLNQTFVNTFIEQAKEVQKWCLEPGLYAKHLQRWLKYFPSRQIMLVDTDLFKKAPVAILQSIESFLRVKNPLNYTDYLEFNDAKKFFCLREGRKYPVWDGGFNWKYPCLGSNKGRLYDKLDPNSTVYKELRQYYSSDIKELHRVIRENEVWRNQMALMETINNWL